MRNAWFVVMAALVVLYAVIASAQSDVEQKKEDVEKAVEVKAESKAEAVNTEAEAETEEGKIEVKEVEPFSYCAVEMTGSFKQHGDAFGKLYSSAEKQGLPTNEPLFGVYYDNPEETAEEELKWEVGFAVSDDTEVEEPLVLKKWEFKLVVSLDYEGPFSGEEMDGAFAEIMQWIEENGYTIVGPCMERYLGMPSQNEDGAMSGKIEIWMPVEKAE